MKNILDKGISKSTDPDVGIADKAGKLAKGIFSIRTKLVLGFIATVLPIFVLGYLSYGSATRAITETASEASLETVKEVNKYLDASLNRIEDFALQLTIDKNFQNYLANVNKPFDAKILEAKDNVKVTWLNSLLLSKNKMAQIFIMLDNDRSLLTGQANPKIDFMEIQNSDTYKMAADAKGEKIWTGYHSDIDSLVNGLDQYALSLVCSLRDIQNSNAIGLLVIDMQRSFIADALSGINLGDGSQLHLITPDGRDIGFKITGGESSALDESEENELVNASIFQRIVSDSEREGSFIDTYNGSEHLVLYSGIGDTGLTLVGLIPTANFTERASDIQRITVLFTVIAVIVGLAIGFVLSVSMGKAITKIIQKLQLAAGGDLTVNIKTKRRDELGVLADNFNIMIENMRELVSGASRTAQSVIASADTVATTSKDVTLASEEVAKAVEDISKGATSQAGDAELCSVKIRDLATQINAVSEFATMIKNYTSETIKRTREGVGMVDELESKASETTLTARSILGDIRSLEANSKNINNIIDVIKGIANQTNLLALNAAIEAARAGDSGRGFSVVADEIRKLAEQSALSANEISKIIQENQAQIQNAVKRAMDTEDIVRSQNAAVANTLEAFSMISAAMEDLAGKVDEVTARVAEMDRSKDEAVISIQNITAVSQEIAAATEEVTASTEEQLSSIEELSAFAQRLNETAQELQKAIRKFKV